MDAQKNGPAERANAHGAVFAVTLTQGNHMIDSTCCDRELHPSAFNASREAGFLAAQAWARQNGQSLGAHRDAELARTIGQQAAMTDDYSGDHVMEMVSGFLEGYSAGIVDLIRGGARHD